jgi:uncharacterized repeat protein (TIGR01451 family)
VPNNVYGWGRIDAYAAYLDVHLISLEKLVSASEAEPGDLITYTLTITHVYGISSTTNVVLTDTIPVGSAFVSATSPHTQTGDIIRWGFPSLDAMGTASVELVVRADITTTGRLVNDDYAVRSDQVAWLRGSPVSTFLGEVYFLPVTIRSP